MEKTIEKLRCLPLEIVEQIYSNLSIAEAESTIFAADLVHVDYIAKGKEVARKFTKDSIFKRRCSVKLYLSRHFSKLDALLEAMLINNVYIVGSRALDFFVPGSAMPDSDWNFSMVNIPNSIYHFMENSKVCGIEWLTTEKYFEQELEDNSLGIELTYEQILYLATTNNLVVNNATKLAIEQIKQNKTFKSIKKHYRDIMSSNKKIVKITNKYGTVVNIGIAIRFYELASIIHGILTYRNNKTKVQLQVLDNTMSQPRFYDPIDHIVNSPISILQCFINATTAVHMYPHHIYEKNMIKWNTVNSSYLDSFYAEQVQKYLSRGYKSITSELEQPKYYSEAAQDSLRSLSDSKSQVIRIRNFDESEKSLATDSSIRTDIIHKLIVKYTWIQDHHKATVNKYAEDILLDSYRTASDEVMDVLRGMLSEYELRAVEEECAGTTDIPKSDIEKYFERQYTNITVPSTYFAKYCISES